MKVVPRSDGVLTKPCPPPLCGPDRQPDEPGRFPKWRQYQLEDAGHVVQWKRMQDRPNPRSIAVAISTQVMSARVRPFPVLLEYAEQWRGTRANKTVIHS